MLCSRIHTASGINSKQMQMEKNISLLLWATCDYVFVHYFSFWVTWSKSCGFGATWGQATPLTLKERTCEHFMVWCQSYPLGLSMHVASESRSHSFRYQRSAESEVELSEGTGCTEGLAEIPLNYAVEWAHPHSHISTIHVWAVSLSPQAILTHIHIRLRQPLCSYTSRHPRLLQLQSSHCIALNTLSITRTTWLTLTLIISPLELPVLCWNGWLFVTLTAHGLVSVWLAVRGKRNEKTWIYRSGLAGQWQFNTPFVMKSSSQLWSLCLIRINLVGVDWD